MNQPNILILMCDQLRGDVVAPGHPCKTPNFDKLHTRGLRIEHGYAPNAICSPSRASMMTGLLPHNHGVLTVTHCVDDDQSVLRTEHPHFAQRLESAGYYTGYFGKWHVERTNDLQQFGWQITGGGLGKKQPAGKTEQDPWVMRFEVDRPRGWRSQLHYGITRTPVEERPLGKVAAQADAFLDEAMKGDKPWCCMVSAIDPHDPFVCGEDVYQLYNVDEIPLPPTVRSEGRDQPNIYRKAAGTYAHMTDRQHREAIACYYGNVTEIDRTYGKLIDKLEAAGQLNNTIIVLTSDHGEMLSEHGLYTKNCGAFESVYHIPMTLAGPGIPSGVSVNARVGLHDLGPTLCELVGAEPIDVPDSRSFAPLIANPADAAADFQTGLAEYFGARFMAEQRVIWDGPWKYCVNAFDFDEMYNLEHDRHEQHNLASDPAHADRAEQMLKLFWRIAKETNNHTLVNMNYPGIRAMIPIGPGILED